MFSVCTLYFIHFSPITYFSCFEDFLFLYIHPSSHIFFLLSRPQTDLNRGSHADYTPRVFPPFIQTSLCRVYPDRQYIQTNLEWKCCCEVGSPSWDTGLLLPVNWCWKKTFSIVLLLLLTASLVFDRLWILLTDNLNIKFHFAVLK